MAIKFSFEATGIGSLPFKGAKEACRAVLDNFTAIPFWPQLPKRSFLENMYCQFSEGIPGVVIDEKRGSVHIDTARALEGAERVYEAFLGGDVGRFGISERYAAGLYGFAAEFSGTARKARFVKGHTTGAVSFALSVTDEKKAAAIHNKEIFGVILKALCQKARWQVRMLKKLNANVIIFMDEPYLVSIGSSFVNIPPETVKTAIDELSAAIREEGALSGVHCCGNTDWPMLLERSIDIISFDAYNFTKEFALYSKEVGSFSRAAGTVAWGIVPSSRELDSESPASLEKKLGEGLKALSERSVDTRAMSSLITPSCGLGTLDEKTALKCLEMTGRLSRKAKI
jgi:methionine synthase II (cobalamin-independent)